jgi:hypothetical protein
MAREELRGRDNWQTESGPGGKAGVAEHNLYDVFRSEIHLLSFLFYIVVQYIQILWTFD